MRSLVLAPVALILLAGCQSAEQRAERDRLNAAAAVVSADGRSYGDGAVKTGEPRACIQVSAVTRTEVLSDRVIDFGVAGRTYRNVLPEACPNLRFEQRIIYEAQGGQLCRPQLIRVFQPYTSIPGPACQIGEFQPVERPKGRNRLF